MAPRAAPRSTRTAAAWLVVLGLLAAAQACSPYEPSLPGTPFLCGDQEPACPEGYVCVGEPDGRKVCMRAGSVPPDASVSVDRMPGTR
jgi:hypothetical protein